MGDDSVSKFISLLISGIVSGAIYSMLAVGLTLTYTTTGIFNLGYGAVAFTCAFVYFELQNGLGWPNVWAGIVVILVLAPLLGLILDRFIFRRLSQASDASKIMATVGVLIALPALAEYIVALLIGVGHFDIPDGSLVSLAPGLGPEPAVQWHISSALNFNSDQLIVAIVAFLMAIGLWWLLKHTTIGLKMRALVDRPDLATARGVDRGRTSGFAWVLGTTLAGLAGVAGAPIFNSLTTGTYLFVLLAATAAAVLGGFRSIPLAALGGLIIGAVQSLVAGYANFAESIPGFSDAVPFVLLFIGLAFWGRERGRLAGSAAEDVPPPDYLALRPPWRRVAPWIFWFTVIFVYILFGADSYWLGLATQGLALSVVFLSFTIVTGTGGIVSLAQAAFVTGAGLMAGVLIGHYHVAYFPALLGGVAFAVFLGVVVAVPALRLGGLSLALATLAMGLVADNVLFQWSWLAGPLQQGWAIPQPTIGPFHLSDDKTMAVFLAIIVIVVTLADTQSPEVCLRTDDERRAHVGVGCVDVGHLRQRHQDHPVRGLGRAGRIRRRAVRHRGAARDQLDLHHGHRADLAGHRGAVGYPAAERGHRRRHVGQYSSAACCRPASTSRSSRGPGHRRSGCRRCSSGWAPSPWRRTPTASSRSKKSRASAASRRRRPSGRP